MGVKAKAADNQGDGDCGGGGEATGKRGECGGQPGQRRHLQAGAFSFFVIFICLTFF